MPAPLTPDSRGTLFPRRLPTQFRRVPASPGVAELVAWWWMSEWDLRQDEVSVQHLLAFPASNLVVEDTMVGLSGPTTRASSRTLSGCGWALAALLRPAAVPTFTPDPRDVRDRYQPLEERALHELVMRHGIPRLEDAIEPFGHWLLDRVGPVGDEARLANRLVQVAGDDPTVTTVPELAGRLHVSERTLHRVARRYVGLTPYSIIRRRRLQEAAERLRSHPDEPLAGIAARFGFSDQAHFAREFAAVIGRTPTDYRADVASLTS